MNQNILLKALFFSVCFLTLLLSNPKTYSQSCNDWLKTPAAGSFVTIGDLDITGDKLTVEAVFNRVSTFDNTINFGKLVSKHTDASNVNYSLMPSQCEITTNVTGYVATPFVCPPDFDKTYHVAMVYDGATLKFYRDGYVLSQVACTGNLINNNLLTTIGQLAGAVQPADMQHWGYINEVRIWKAARTQAELKAFMHTSLSDPAGQNGLVAYYAFDDLLNKQGNPVWNGTLKGGAAIDQANPNCTFSPLYCPALSEVVPDFVIPDTVCVNTPLNISNISMNATSNYWNFCVADANSTPEAVNLGNPGGSLSWPVFTDIITENGNYYMFVSNNWPGGLVRLDFGNSLLNNPTVVNLGTAGGVIPNTIEGIQVVKNEGRWYAIMVGGDMANGNIPSRVIKIDFGTSITNINPVGTNWGNIGNLAYPTDLHVFEENGIWYGFTVNAQNNTITRFNFSNSFTNTPTAVNLGNLGGLSYPTGINAIKDNGNWHVFITNDLVNSFLVRLDFGNSLLNTPIAVNLGNPGNVLRKTRDIYIMKACDQITALAVNGDGYNDLVKLDFNNNITSAPTGVSLGNTGNMNFPHSISKLFRVGNDLYTFVTNVRNHSLTRIRFPGCTSTNIPNSSLQNPPPITYTTPGTYNISLTIDDGLPTQSSVCKQVVVKDCSKPVTPDFDIPDTVCVNTPVTITNTTTGATTHYWNFNVADIQSVPEATNIGNPGSLSAPVFMDYVQFNNNWYGFLINHEPGALIRLDFGNSLLNTPTSTNLGNFGGAIPPGPGAEGIQMVFNEGKWYAIIVGGYTLIGSTPRIIKIDFGANLLNPTPVATNWGNIGNLLFPVDLHVFKEGSNWYGFTVNAENNTIVRFNFSNSFDNVPTAVNLGNLGNLDFPTGIYAINDNNDWKVFVLNRSRTTNYSLTRLDFGSSLLNTPTAVNLGNPGNTLKQPRDFTIMKFCGETIGFVVNEQTSDIVRLNFNRNLSSVPTATSLGNIGQISFPHSLSKFFRVGADVYSFITNVNNNTITRLKFNGSTASSIPSSTLQNPSPVTYSTPGTYNINLTIDDGLPTQASVCKQIVVKDCTDSIIINDYTPVLSFDPCKNLLNVEDASEFNVGDTVLMIQMKGAIIDSANSANFGTITDYRNAGNYEFNYVKAITGNTIELLNVVERQYDVTFGKVQLVRVPYFQDYNATSILTCLPWDGNKGGVLVFNVQNTLTLEKNIDVSGKGFKGGSGMNSGLLVSNCFNNDYIYPSTSTAAAAKGESITTISNNISNGKGAPAGAGGGGLDHNSGGGGGGNGGVGGFGGYQLEPCGNSPFDNRGIGGRNLAYNNTANKIFMGSGGGAGHANNPGNISQPSSGGNGGGIIIITAQNLQINNSSRIIANGNNAPECIESASADCHDAMGGGGAGGTILLNIPVIFNNAPIEIKGGKGANMTGSVPVGGRIGAGGGGSGGIFWAATPALLPNIVVNNAGGTNGVLIQDGNSSWGATPGQNGISLFDLQLPVDDVLFKANIDSVRIRKMATDCSSFSFEGLDYVKTHPITSWQWSFGDGAVASTQNTNHSYSTSGNYTVKLVITDINGCKDSTTTDVNASALNFDFSYKQDVCDPLTVQFNGLGNPLNNSFWDFGDGNIATGNSNPVHTYAATGNYLVRYSIGDGVCVDTIRKTISINILQDNLVLTADTTICYGSVKQLRTVPSLSFCWSPTTYLDNPNSPNPVTSAIQDITYYFTAEVTGTNLISNGNFSQGNTGFTSGYNFAGSNTTEGQYYVGTSPQAWNNSLSACMDHTTGNGNMMMINGSPTPDVNVWKQTVNVTPNTNYAFSTWIQALWPPNPAQLQFSINGKDAGSLITASLPTCTWTQFYTTWNSGNNTTAVISIVNKNTQVQGNDFALDDISFAPVFIKRDSVKIKVENPSVRTNKDTIVCSGNPVQLNATGAQAYSWSPAIALSNTSISNPVASPAISTEYIVTGTTINGCSAKDTVNVNVYAIQAIVISKDTIICSNSSAQLLVTGGTGYSWSPAATLSNPNIYNPVATPGSNTRYYVTVTDGNRCEYKDSTDVTIRSKAVFAINEPKQICVHDSLQLTASGGNIYSWQPAEGLSNTGIANPMVSPSVTTDYQVTITETACNESQTLSTRLVVMPLPSVSATKSNDIDCSNDRSQLNATGADQYLWTPAATLSNPGIYNPLAKPVSATQYIVEGTDIAGCKGYDTITVKVDNVNKSGYLMPNAFTPNNDGLNDCYGVRYWGIIESFEFSIYNRWGERLFFTKNGDKCWDGTYKGIQQDGGVYVYMIKAKTNCEAEVFRKGTFVLIR